MKLFKSFLLLIVVATSMSLVSCLDEDKTQDQTYSTSGYFTIKGTNPNYKLYSDGGGIFVPTTETVTSLTSSQGFGNYDRAYMNLSYSPSNVTTDSASNEDLVSKVKIASATLIPTADVMTIEEAQTKLLADSDSVSYINDFSDAWICRGYLTVYVKNDYCIDANGNKLYPTMNIAYDPNSIKDNSINFSLFYNRHTYKNAPSSGIAGIVASFRLGDIVSKIPGSDNVVVTVTPYAGGSVKTIDSSRRAFKF